MTIEMTRERQDCFLENREPEPLLALELEEKQVLEAAPRLGRRPCAVLFYLFAEVPGAVVVRRSFRFCMRPSPLPLSVHARVLLEMRKRLSLSIVSSRFPAQGPNVEDATMTNGGGKKHGEQKSGQKGQTKDSKPKAKGGKS